MRTKIVRLAGAGLVLGGLAMPLAMAADAIRLKVDTDQPGRVLNREVTAGFNFGNWVDMAEFGETLHQNVPPAILRFPGGNVGDDRDIEANMLDLFVTNLGLLKADVPVVIQTRVFPGRGDQVAKNSPEDAAEAVRLAHERKLKVVYWQIGNEPDLYATNRGDPSWTPEHYCEVFRAQAKAIRAVDPAAKFAGPAVSGAVPASADYLERFVTACGDTVDLLTWHIYPTAGAGSEEDALATIGEPERWFAHYRKMWADPARNPLGHAREVKYAMTEYGLSWSTNNAKYLADMPAAMFAAESALRMAREGLDAAYYFAYQGMGFHGLLDMTGVPRPSYYGFRMINPLKGRFVPVATEDAGVWAHAVLNGNRLSVVLMNTHKVARSVPVTLAGWTLASGEWFDEAIVEQEAEPGKLKLGTSVELPARAMMRLDFVAQ